MSFTRIVPRFTGATKKCNIRCLSSGRKNQSEDILDILPGRSSTTQSHPSTPITQAPRLSPSRFAQQNVPQRAKSSEEVEAFTRQQSYTKQVFRKWNAGDVYTPHDLTGNEQYKWKRAARKPQGDVIDLLGINPISEYKNYTLMSEFMTEMGRIKHSKQTGLRPVNQRRMAKAIRRAIGLGLMPSVHRHPLVLKKTDPGRWNS